MATAHSWRRWSRAQLVASLTASRPKLFTMIGAEGNVKMISKGTIITCEDKGHPIASMGRHVKQGEKVEAEDLEKWRADEPEPGEDVSTRDCPDCGSKWARKHKDGGIQIHTQHDGWQPGEDEGLK